MTLRVCISRLVVLSLLVTSGGVGGCKDSAAPAEPEKTQHATETGAPGAGVFALLHAEQCLPTTLADPNANHTVEMPLAVVSGMGTYDLRLKPEPALPPLNAPFSLEVTITERTSENPEAVSEEVELLVDGWMPVHLHGLAIRPSIRRTAQGVYQVNNLLLHMEGDWQVFFDVTNGPLTERAQIDLVIR